MLQRFPLAIAWSWMIFEKATRRGELALSRATSSGNNYPMKMLAPICGFLLVFVCGCGKPTALPTTLPPPAASEWEYQRAEWQANFTNVAVTISAGTKETTEKVECNSTLALLNLMGKHGWDLASVNFGLRSEYFFFKRARRSEMEVYIFEPQEMKKPAPTNSPIFK